MTELYQRTGQHSNRSERHDPELENGIKVSQNPPNDFHDRVYDVRGFDGIFIQLANYDYTNERPADYTIDIASHNFDDVNDVSGWTNDVPTTELDTDDVFTKEYIRISPKITAIRIRLQRGDPGHDVIVNGIVSAR